MLQDHGLIRGYGSSVEQDPYGRAGVRCKVYRCTIAQGSGAARYLERDGAAGMFTGRQVRHGTHPMCVAAILECGGPLPSHTEVHEYTYPGVYTCEESELTPLWFGTRARIQTSSIRYDGTQYGSWPVCQFVFRGMETTKGYSARRDRTYGEETQWIYRDAEDVLWYEMQVWVGVAPQNRGERSGLYEVSPIRDASRRATRLVKRTNTKLQLVADSEYDPQVHTLEQTTSMEHTVMGSVWDGWD